MTLIRPTRGSKRQANALLCGMRQILKDKRASAKEKLMAAQVIMLVQYQIDFNPLVDNNKSFYGKGLAELISSTQKSSMANAQKSSEINNLSQSA